MINESALLIIFRLKPTVNLILILKEYVLVFFVVRLFQHSIKSRNQIIFLIRTLFLILAIKIFSSLCSNIL